MRKTTGPTPMQTEVMKAIASYHRQYRTNPSYRDVAIFCHITETRVQQHLQALGKKGYVTNTPGLRRSLELTAEGKRALQEEPNANV